MTARFVEESTPTTPPPAGRVYVYAKSDGIMYSMDDAGVETQMASGAAILTFSTIATPFGTSPVADTSADTLNLTSSDFTITGTALTDTVDFSLNTVPIAKGGTGQTTALAAFEALSPITTRGDLVTRDASNDVRLPIGAANRLLRSDGTDPSWAQADLTTDVTGVLPSGNIATNVKRTAFGITIDSGGSTISTGIKGFVTIPFAMTITGWDILADQVGSIVVDVWKDIFANYPPTVADTIAGSEKPTLTAQDHNQDTTLTTWTTAVAAGDIVGFKVDSASTVTRVTIVIYGTKT